MQVSFSSSLTGSLTAFELGDIGRDSSRFAYGVIAEGRRTWRTRYPITIARFIITVPPFIRLKATRLLYIQVRRNFEHPWGRSLAGTGVTDRLSHYVGPITGWGRDAAWLGVLWGMHSGGDEKGIGRIWEPME